MNQQQICSIMICNCSIANIHVLPMNPIVFAFNHLLEILCPLPSSLVLQLCLVGCLLVVMEALYFLFWTHSYLLGGTEEEARSELREKGNKSKTRASSSAARSKSVLCCVVSLHCWIGAVVIPFVHHHPLLLQIVSLTKC